MALTLTEQLDLINGTITPPDTSLENLVTVASYKYAVDFMASHKAVDPATSPKAELYLNKLLGACNQAIKGNNRTYEILKRTMVAVIGNTNVTLAQVQGATQAQWENFVSNNIDEVFEYVSSVKLEEKSEYNALP